MRESPRRVMSVAAVAGLFVLTGSAACGSDQGSESKPNESGDDATPTDPTVYGDFGRSVEVEAGPDGPPPARCIGLQCQQHDCTGGTPTTVRGVVYDPAGKNPLYNVVVYVPNEAVKPLPRGASCDSCNSLYSGSPVVVATTNSSGEFTLTNAPDGQDIPLVVQVGKWRRQLTIPSIARCAETVLPDRSVRLPKNGSEGDIPQIAIATGAADSLECLLRRVGVDAEEYAAGGGAIGHIHIFTGPTSGSGSQSVPSPSTSPEAPRSSTALWQSAAELAKYDIVLLSCEGQETSEMNQQALFDYAAAGGRVFGSHFHYAWFNTGPFGSKNLASWKTGTNDLQTIQATIETKLSSGAAFPKGEALKEWLGLVGALDGAGELTINQARDNALVTADHTASQAWITARTKAPGATQYFTFNTPLGTKPEDQCGRVVYSDLHVGAASGDYARSEKIVPSGCGTGDLSAQEKALEFMLFDLSSCVTPDDRPPPPPPPPPPPGQVQ